MNRLFTIMLAAVLCTELTSHYAMAGFSIDTTGYFTNRAQRLQFGRQLRSYFVFISDQVQEPGPSQKEWVEGEISRIARLTNGPSKETQRVKLMITDEWKLYDAKKRTKDVISAIDCLISKQYLTNGMRMPYGAMYMLFQRTERTPWAAVRDDVEESEILAWLDLDEAILIADISKQAADVERGLDAQLSIGGSASSEALRPEQVIHNAIIYSVVRPFLIEAAKAKAVLQK